MTENARALIEQALRLPPAERMNVAYEIIESVEGKNDGELTPEWSAEIGRRIDEIVSGKAGPDEDYRVVMERLRRRAEEKSGPGR